MSSLLSAGLLPVKLTLADDASQRKLQTPTVHQLANRGGLASSSQGRFSCSVASTSDDAAQRPRHIRVRAAATLIEAEVNAPESAKPSSAGASTFHLCIPDTPLPPFSMQARAHRGSNASRQRRSGQDYRRSHDTWGSGHRGRGPDTSGDICQLCPG